MARGSSFERLIEHHNNHYRSCEKILKTFKDNGVETRVVERYDLHTSMDDFDWADCVFSAGGDGTFLMAASKIYNDLKPIIGINTDVCK
jgi:NAD+ kinase